MRPGYDVEVGTQMDAEAALQKTSDALKRVRQRIDA
jgi:hypothetical protein